MDRDTLDLALSLKAAVRQHGWVTLSLPSEINPQTLASLVGPTVAPHTLRSATKVLSPYTREAAPRGSMSAITGTGPQPMHTDCAHLSLPPRYVLLRCLSRGEANCPTRIWRPNLRDLEGSTASLLRRPGWVVRGGGRHPPFYAQVLNRTWLGEPFFRFDSCCMAPPGNDGSLADAIRSGVQAHSCCYDLFWAEQDILLLDNWICLHARGAGAESAPSRRLERWLIGDGDGMVR